MRAALYRISTAYLVAYVGVVDATVWLAALPFELYCKSLLARHDPGTLVLVLILVINALLIALMGSSIVATAELVRRGFTRPARAAVPVPVQVRSRRSGY
jgi:hypothetical protein